MQQIMETPILGPVTVSQHVVKHFSKLCSGDFDKAAASQKVFLKALT